MSPADTASFHNNSAGDVLCMTDDPVLLLDIRQALSIVGLRIVTQPSSVDAHYRAAILDTDSRHTACILSPTPSNLPVVVIADTEDAANALHIPQTFWFAKPVCTDTIAEHLARLLSKTASASALPI